MGKKRRHTIGKYYAVIDTNVLVSALLSFAQTDSATVKVLKYVLWGLILPVYNAEILDEYERVLSRDKFHFDPSNVRTLIDQIRALGVAEDRLSSDEHFTDPDDAVFFEVTLSRRAKAEHTYLVTGNLRHYPAKPYVVSPRQMVELLEK